MNKLFTKIAALSVGLALAVGVGVVVGSKGAKVVKADSIATWDASSQGFSNEQQLSGESYVFSDSAVSISFGEKVGNGHKYFNSGSAVRSYGGNSFTISCSAGNMTSITLSNNQSKAASANVGTLEGNNWTGDASSVTFTIDSGSGNFRTSTVSVTYGADPSLKSMVIYTSGNPADGGTILWSKNAGTHNFSAKEEETTVSGVAWSVNDETVATINASTGALTTLKPGNIVIYAEAEGYNKASASVTISKGSLEELVVSGSMSKTSYYVGEDWSHAGLVVTATFHSGWEEDVADDSATSWSYNPASPAQGVTSVVAKATYEEESVSSESQTVSVTKTNPIQVLYTKSAGSSVDVYGYYVGFLDGTGPVIMDGAYGIVIYDKTADVSGYTEKETILHVTGSISIYKGLYEVGSPSISVASGTYEAPEAPVVYATNGNETADYASRLTTVTGTPTVTSGSFDSAAGTADIKMNFAVGVKTVQVFYKKAAQTADSECFGAIKDAVANSEEITIKGFTGWYDGFQVQMNGYVKPAETYTAEQFAQDLVDQTDAVCDGYKEGDNNHDALEAIWSDLASNDKYPSLPKAQKDILAEAARDESGTVVEQAMARYDFLTGKYNLSNFINGRTPIVLKPEIEFSTNDTNSLMLIIVAIAATSAIALGALLILKKKKHQ